MLPLVGKQSESLRRSIEKRIRCELNEKNANDPENRVWSVITFSKEYLVEITVTYRYLGQYISERSATFEAAV